MLLDNSNMSIENEVHQVIEALKNYIQFKYIPKEYWQEVNNSIDIYTDLFINKGKKHMIGLLEEDGLSNNPSDIITEITKLFPEDVNSFPDNIKNLFFKIDLKNE